MAYYTLMARLHLWLTTMREDRAGQGTVEYVGLILLIAGVIAGVIAIGKTLKGGGIAETVVRELKTTIDGVGKH